MEDGTEWESQVGGFGVEGVDFLDLSSSVSMGQGYQ